MAEEKLTPAQAMAVERRGGPILVSAAAGSGKTKVIVKRLMRRILSRDEDCNINDFLIITFTKKAAAELRDRIAKELAAQLAEDPENVHLQRQQSRIYLTKITTVHAFCADLIREFAYELDVPADFRMLEEVEAAALREELSEDLLEERYETISQDPALQQLVDGLGAGRDDRRLPGLLLDVYRTAQCRLYPERWLAECAQSLELAGIRAAEQTPWGKALLEDLQQLLEEEIAIFRTAVDTVERNPALDPYRTVFRQNLTMLEALQRLHTWDEVYAAAQSKLDTGRLPTIRDCQDPEAQERVKTLRKDAFLRVREKLAGFYGDSEAVLSDLGQTAETLRALFSLTEAFSARYRAEKQRLHALDFNDLEHLALRLLLEPDGKTPTDTAKQISGRFLEIMVDEYQDTNEVQDSLFRAISRGGTNRFMVGDVKQSIYRFRLADPTIFLKKYQTYPDAAQVGPEDRQRILLSKNFRSGEAILEAANAVFRCCMSPRVGGLVYGPEEALEPGLPKEPLPQTQVELHCLNTKAEEEEGETPEKARAEADYAAERIARLLREGTRVRGDQGSRPVKPGDIVILLRSPRSTGGFYLEALRRRGIPAVSDSGESILDTREVETLLCLLKAIDNVHRDVPLAGALLSPLFGVSASELALARGRSQDPDLYDSLRAAEDPSPALSHALQVLESLRTLSRSLPLHSLLEQIRQQTELEALFCADPRGALRQQNLRLFSELAASYAEGGKKSLHQFLRYVAMLKEEGGVSRETARTEAVTVMSIHKSKGLEFPVVVLSDLSRRFNTEDLKAQVQFHSRLGVGCSVYDAPTHTRFPSIAQMAISRRTREENLSEELRILYVAMTRARDMLIMTCCSGNLKNRLTYLADRLTPDTAPILAGRAGCPGDWILQTALLRTEAGALHRVGGRPAGVRVSEQPWRIEYQELRETADGAETGEPLPAGPEPDLGELTRALRYAYPAPLAAAIPSKLTATQLKGRQLDEEAAAESRSPLHPGTLRRPNLIHGDRPLTPAERGTAVHQAMQYLDFSRTDSPEAVARQLQELTENQFLTPKQAEAVDPEKLYRVFTGPLGRELREADQVIREFKFSLLTPAERYYPGAGEEQLMLQGVTDCCLIRDGAITVVDFKTDRVTAATQSRAAEHYRPQLEAYSRALARIFGLPVRRRLLYFFQTDALVEV